MTFAFTYDDVDFNTGAGFDDPSLGTQRIAALEDAASTVGSWFGQTATINVNVAESEFSGTFLAEGGGDYPTSRNSGFNNLGPVEQEIRTGIDPNPSTEEAEIVFNFSRNFALGDTVGAAQDDFKAAAMHELIHIVGFASNILENGDSDIAEGPSTVWGLFDQFVADSSGVSIIDQSTFQIDLARWDTAKTTGLTFNGPNAMAANGGQPVPLYAPSTFVFTDSVSHVDEDSPGIGPLTHLMVSHGAVGVVNARELHPVERGMLEDLGLTVVVAPEIELTESDDFTSVTEDGDTDTITVALNTAPASDVVLSVSSPEAGQLSFDKSQLTFTPQNWNIPQTVTISAIDDSIIEDFFYFVPVRVAVVPESSDDNFDGLATQTITVEVSENDFAGFTVTESSGNTQIAEGGATDSVSVVLDAAPSSDVVFTVTSSDAAQATLNKSSLTFTPTNWQTPQTVTVMAVDDQIPEAEQTVTLTVAINQASSDDAFDFLSDKTVDVTVTDDDLGQIPEHLIVDTVLDGIDGDVGPGHLSLREAVSFANLRPGRDTITFRFSVGQNDYVLDAAEGPIVITDDLDLQGNGATTISGNSQTRILQVGTEADLSVNRLPQVAISSLSLEEGFTTGRGGAILNYGDTHVEHVTFRLNKALEGGAIYNERVPANPIGFYPARMTLTSVDLDNNVADGGSGGAIYSEAPLTIDGFSTLTNNRATKGGAIYAKAPEDHAISISNSYFTDNSASVEGGALYLDISAQVDVTGSQFFTNSALADASTTVTPRGGAIFTATSSVLEVATSYFEGNTADTDNYLDRQAGDGGAIAASGGTISVSRSTFSRNWARVSGGAVFTSGPTNIDFRNSTLSENGLEVDDQGQHLPHTGTGGAIFNASGSRLAVADSTLYGNEVLASSGQGFAIYNAGEITALHNSIVASNYGAASQQAITNAGTAFAAGAVTFNLLQDTLGMSDDGAFDGTGYFSLPGNNIYDRDGLFDLTLGPLQDNGGPVPTRLPPGDSIVIDNGESDSFIDQRGFPVQALTVGGNRIRDIGAVELQQVVVNSWEETIAGASQFSGGDAAVYGFGFDDGQPDSDGDGRSDLSGVQKKPEFLGFEFDPDRFTIGGITTGNVGDRYGAELSTDIDGRFGLDLGFYANSGSVDVTHSGQFGYSVDQVGNTFNLDPTFSFESGSVYAISPRFGAYADLVVQLNAPIDVEAAFFGSASKSFSINFDKTIPLFSINRPQTNADGSPVLVDLGNGNMAPALDGEIKLAGSSLLSELFDKLKDSEDDKLKAERDEDEARKQLAEAKTPEERAAAQQALDDATMRRTQAEAKQSSDRADQTAQGSSFGSVRSLIGVELGEADGSLLGFQGTLSVGLGGTAGGVGADIGKDLGSLAITLPDVQLVDRTVDSYGVLSASTDDFSDGSLADEKRQVAQLNVDLGALTGFGGTTNVTLGPIGVQYQTVSYIIQPTLGITQDIRVTPFVKSLSADFPAGVTVTVNDTVRTTNGGHVTYGVDDTLHVDVLPGQQVAVTPSAVIGTKLTNDIGLDVDLKGIFEALSFMVSIFGEDVLDEGPLFEHTHDLAEFDLGSIFNETFELPDRMIAGAPIILGMTQNVIGASPATPLIVDGSRTFNPSTSGASDGTVFTSVEMLDDQGQLNQTLDLTFTGGTVTGIGVIEDGLMLEVLDAGGNTTSTEPLFPGQIVDVPAGASYRLSTYSVARLVDSAEALVALRFSGSPTSVTMTATPGNPIAARVAPPADMSVPGKVNQEVVDQNNAQFEQNTGFDIDDNGRIEAATDGLLVVRYMSGVRGTALIDDLVGSGASRTTSAEIENYLTGLNAAGRLDLDGNGTASASTDGKLLVRSMAGFAGAALIDGAIGSGATRTTAEQIQTFLRDGLSNIDNSSAFSTVDQTKSFRDMLEQSVAFDPNVLHGSTPWAPLTIGSEINTSLNLSSLGTTVGGKDLYVKDSVDSTDRSQWDYLGTIIDGDSNRLQVQNVDNPGSESVVNDFSARVVSEDVTRVLGMDTPIYLRLPDRDGYRISATAGQKFTELHLPRDVRGNGLLAAQIDVFVPATGQWHVVNLDTPFTFPEPVSEFEIYSRTLPSRSYDSTLAAVSTDLDLRLGLILQSVSSGRTIQIAAIGDERPEHLRGGGLIPVTGAGTITINRDKENYTLKKDGSTLVFPISGASIDGFSVRGPEDSSDTITLDLDETDGPIGVPVFIAGGGEEPSAFTDTLVISGQGHFIDLTSQVFIDGIEIVDLRGSGSNSLFLDLEAMFENRGTNQTLRVRLDSGDSVGFSTSDQISPGDRWNRTGSETVDGVNYNVYQLQRTINGVQRTEPFRVLIEQAGGIAIGQGGGDTFVPSSIVQYPVPGTSRLLSTSQVVSPAVANVAANTDSPFEINLDYHQGFAGAGDNDTEFLNLQVHYDSRLMTFDQIVSSLPDAIMGMQDGVETVSDGDPTTDRMVELLWYRPTGSWQTGPLDVSLAGLRFVASGSLRQSTVRISGDTSNGHALSSTPITVIGVGDIDPSHVVVDNVSDESDGDFSPGDVSLREAIELTNGHANGITRDVIEFDATVFGSAQTVQLSLGELSITDSVAITGPGRELLTLDGLDASRIISVTDGDSGTDLSVEISGLTMTRGFGTDGDDGTVSEDDSGGAIRTFETLTLQDVAVTNSAARAGGGGIYNKGRLIVNSSLISGNTSTGAGGGIENALGSTATVSNAVVADNQALEGGGIYNSNVLTVTGSTVRNNQATSLGGGIFIRNLPSVVAGISDSSIIGNMSSGSGGGIMIQAVATTSVQIKNTTILGNMAAADGGGISIFGTRPIVGSSISISGTTISGNSAGDDGGGLDVVLATSTVTQSTISGNTAVDVSGGVRSDVADLTITGSTVTANSGKTGGGLAASQYTTAAEADPGLRGSLTLISTLIAGNTDVDGTPDLLRTGDGALTVHSSLIGDNTGSTLSAAPVGSPDANGNLIGTSAGPIDPLLGPLKDNGGSTFTHALLAGSPAIDVGRSVLDDFSQDNLAAHFNFFGYLGSPANATQIVGEQLQMNVGSGKAAGLIWNQGDTLSQVGDTVAVDLAFDATQTNGDSSAGLGFFSSNSDGLLAEIRVESSGLFRDGQNDVFLSSGTAEGLKMTLQATVTAVTASSITVDFQLSGAGFDTINTSRTLSVTQLFFGPVAYQTSGNDAVHDNLRSNFGGTDQRGVSRTAADIGAFEFVNLPSDYGDAPDTGAGTGSGNYETLDANGGPSHTIVVGLHLGMAVDGDDGTLQNSSAMADDDFGLAGDDEDGVVSMSDLQSTEGDMPSVTLEATNTTGREATLYGWIDYNGDGLFDNATERGDVTVPSGTSGQQFTVTFPMIPNGAALSTYARFRLSTDEAAANPTGPASDGEVEDYAFSISAAQIAAPLDVALPGGGLYDVLRDGADLVVRVAEGAELIRDVAADVSVLRITGSAEDDVVTVLKSGTSVDTPMVFTGGDGNDRFDASLAVGVVNLTGNGGDDVLIGGSGDDTLNGGSGKDELVGNIGDDLVQGQGSTGDTLDGGDGNDTLDGGSGNDLIREFFTGDATLTNLLMTGHGTDTIISAERAMLTGGGAAQTFDLSAFFTAGLTSSIINAGGGDDTIVGTAGADIVSGGGGSDLINVGGGNDRVFGGSGSDTVIGGPGDDFIKGLGGSGDQLIGGPGNDTLNGGRGVDRVIASADADFMLTVSSLTGEGNDVLLALEIAELNAGDSDNLIDVSAFIGFRGFVQVRANGGDDTVIGSRGPDVLNGGDGNDSLVGNDGNDLLNGDAGNDTLLGKDGDDTLNGGDDNDGLSGAGGNDVLNGDRGYDRAFGGEGNDTLTGGNARDTLIGGDGDDSLEGNDGPDTLVGGTGNNDASMGDMFTDSTATIDEAFTLDPLPGWVDQV
ncbi:hypothetical protein GC176_09575 [bacterium]|nr:hypothetical protein [bacterium]